MAQTFWTVYIKIENLLSSKKYLSGKKLIFCEFVLFLTIKW